MIEALSPATVDSLRLLALQVLGQPAEERPGRCILLQRYEPIPAADPGEYRLMIDDGNEEFIYVCNFAKGPVLELAAAKLLTPCELEGDIREHWVLNAQTVQACREALAASPVALPAAVRWPVH